MAAPLPGVTAAWVALAFAWVASRSRDPARSRLGDLPPRGATSRSAAAPASPREASEGAAASGPLQRLVEGAARRRGARREGQAVEAAVPDLVDLFAVAVAAGSNVRLATLAVAGRAPPGPVQEALTAVGHEVAAGARLADALERLPLRLGEPVRPLAAALVDAERYGTALGPTLERLAAETRRARQRRAEEVARRLPVKLLFPLVTCILPAFGLLTVAPLIVGGLRALRP